MYVEREVEISVMNFKLFKHVLVFNKIFPKQKKVSKIKKEKGKKGHSLKEFLFYCYFIPDPLAPIVGHMEKLKLDQMDVTVTQET